MGVVDEKNLMTSVLEAMSAKNRPWTLLEWETQSHGRKLQVFAGAVIFQL